MVSDLAGRRLTIHLEAKDVLIDWILTAAEASATRSVTKVSANTRENHSLLRCSSSVTYALELAKGDAQFKYLRMLRRDVDSPVAIKYCTLIERCLGLLAFAMGHANIIVGTPSHRHKSLESQGH
ncbi:hypothetical protein ColLi_12715 [Colletotrichum liriopes]|uniref:Uncharacterized protein n=1 Tax=Colletotrichum liriopes TaxID=708192 RepID=A0AA37LYX2_9PEZI|nr:hypothetical protein ColLi_12715 [Colletotrichum liriopes]